MSLMLALTLGSLLLASTAPCAAQDGQAAKGTITTTGYATVPVQPDSVRITFGVQLRLFSVKEVRLESEKQAKKLNDALLALKIETLKIETASENLQITMSSNPAGIFPAPDMPPVATGYQVRTSFTVRAKATDLEKLKDIAKRVMDVAVENGANLGTGLVVDDGQGGGAFGAFQGKGGGKAGATVSRTVTPGVEFFKEDNTEARKQALSLAAKNALANAGSLANGANVKIRKIDAITDDGGHGDLDDPYFQAPSRYSRLERSTITSITVRVRVTCSYE